MNQEIPRPQDPYVQGRSPRVEMTEEEFISRVHYFKALMDAIFGGLGFYEFWGNEEYCFDNIEIMLWYYFYSTEIVSSGEFEADKIYNSTYSLTRGIYYISPVLRQCYKFSEENEQQWIMLAQRLFNWQNLFYAVRENFLKYGEQIDEKSYGAYIRLQQGQDVVGMRLMSEFINLIFIRGLPPAKVIPRDGPTVTSSLFNLENTPEQDRFIELLLEMNSKKLDRNEMIDAYLDEKRQKEFLMSKNKGPRVGEGIPGTSRGKFLYPLWPYDYSVNVIA